MTKSRGIGIGKYDRTTAKPNPGMFKNGHVALKGKESPHWKFFEIGYSGIHRWLYREFGKPKKCDDCGSVKQKRYEWANKSGLYKRIRSDWKRLCKKCHMKMDNVAWKISKARNANS